MKDFIKGFTGVWKGLFDFDWEIAGQVAACILFFATLGVLGYALGYVLGYLLLG